MDNKKLAECIYYAIEKHGEQKDYSGIPYIVHLISVMNKLDTIEEKIAAILHDIIEDTNVTADDLRRDLKLQNSTVDAIIHLTHFKNEPNEEYIERVKHNSLATKIKMEDLKHNMNLTRMLDLDEKLVHRLNEKHVRAYRQLTGGE